MKKLWMMLALLGLAILCLGGCSSSKTEDASSKVEINYKKSDIYSQEDMETAVALIQKEFSAWEGCELHKIEYAGDECNSKSNIKWMNDLASGKKVKEKLTQCIEFTSEFHTPKDEKNAGAWDVDEEYTDWQWWLARSENGKWHLMTWGY